MTCSTTLSLPRSPSPRIKNPLSANLGLESVNRWREEVSPSFGDHKLIREGKVSRLCMRVISVHES